MLKYKEQWKRGLTLMHCISTREVSRVSLRLVCGLFTGHSCVFEYADLSSRPVKESLYNIDAIRELGELEFSFDPKDVK